MTRENKLALVVGFGLILLVGILLSDHFSAARRPRPADLAAPLIDPLTRVGYDNATLIEPPRTARPLPRSTPAAGGAGPGVQRIVMGASHRTPPVPSPAESQAPAPPRIGPAPETTRALPFTYHTVAPNETLTSIARRHYGDTSLINELARYNDLENPDSIKPGDRLRIPAAGQLVRGHVQPPPPTTAPPAAPAAAAPRSESITYVVKPGDSLSEIASELLGSARRWREIYEMNRGVIRDPDRVAAGTTLTIARAR